MLHTKLIVGVRQMKNMRDKMDKSNRRTKLGFLIFFGVMIVLAVLLSAGSLSGFIFVFVLEVVFVVIAFFLANAGKKDESARTNKRVDSPEDSEIISSIQASGRKNFDWVVNDDAVGSSKPKAAEKQEEKLQEKPQERDIRAEVARWSNAVRYSGTVFGSIIEKANQQIQAEKEAFKGNEETFPEANSFEKTALTETPVQSPANEYIEAAGFVTCKAEGKDIIEDEYEENIHPWDTRDEIPEFYEESLQEHQKDSPEVKEDKPAKSSSTGNVILFRRPGTAETHEEANSYYMDEDCEEDEIYKEDEDITNSEWDIPIDLLLKFNAAGERKSNDNKPEDTAAKLVETLLSFGVGAKILNISEGPSVTRYEIQPDYGVKVSKIVNLTDDIALNLAATGVRIEAPIPGKAAIGIEVPNKEISPVLLREVIESDAFRNHPSKLAFAVGKDISGDVVVADISKMPHLLIAGATGSGKSVCINTLISSILYKASPAEVKLLMIDPKVVELSIYNGIPHLLIPVVTDPKKAAGALSWAVVEMTSRYKLFAENNVRDLRGYNSISAEKRKGKALPQIVIIVDELADLMMVAPNEVEDCICRLAQMARAAGMHLVIATQRPSVDVITGVIKANIPSRISFAVSSQIDSRTILDMAGAEKLLGRGDMLFSPLGLSKPVRIQGGLITDKEVESIVSHIKSIETARYSEDILKKIESQSETSQADSSDIDELLPQVVNMVIEQGMASTSLIQRKFKLGYARAARILDQMELSGIVGPFEGSKPRKILVTKQEWQEMI